MAELKPCPFCGGTYFRDYPEAVPIVIELQNIVKEQRPDRPPLRGYKYFI